jgi:hypothetical protein
VFCIVVIPGDVIEIQKSEHLVTVLLKAIDQFPRRFARTEPVGVAQLWRDQGKRTEACNLLSPIYAWFTEGLDTPLLRDAKALLEELV